MSSEHGHGSHHHSHGHAHTSHPSSSVSSPASLQTWGARLYNLTAQPLMPQLLLSFHMQGASTVHSVPWAVSQYAISGPAQSAEVTWQRAFAICYGQLADDGSLLVSGALPCQLGDRGFLSLNDGQPTLTIQPGAGTPNSITCAVADSFPDDWYIGFGLIPDPVHQPLVAHPAGVMSTASDSDNVVFTPTSAYLVRFATPGDVGALKGRQLLPHPLSSQDGTFDWTGTVYSFETCSLNADGSWIMVPSTLVA